MENSENNLPEDQNPAVHHTRQRAAAAAVALALALSPHAECPAPPAQPRSAWQSTTRTIQLNQSVQNNRGARGHR